MDASSPLAITLISGAVSIVALLVARLLDRRATAAGVRRTDAETSALTKKTDAEAQDLLTQAAERLVTRYEKQITALDGKLQEALNKIVEVESRLALADATLHNLEVGIAVLTRQVVRLGERPDWP